MAWVCFSTSASAGQTRISRSYRGEQSIVRGVVKSCVEAGLRLAQRGLETRAATWRGASYGRGQIRCASPSVARQRCVHFQESQLSLGRAISEAPASIPATPTRSRLLSHAWLDRAQWFRLREAPA